MKNLDPDTAWDKWFKRNFPIESRHCVKRLDYEDLKSAFEGGFRAKETAHNWVNSSEPGVIFCTKCRKYLKQGESILADCEGEEPRMRPLRMDEAMQFRFFRLGLEDNPVAVRRVFVPLSFSKDGILVANLSGIHEDTYEDMHNGNSECSADGVKWQKCSAECKDGAL